MQDVTFHFDPRCPWCYQTSKWARQLVDLGEIRVDWDVCSLEVLNLAHDADPMSLLGTGSPQLRTAVAIDREHGSHAVGTFYAELGLRSFERFAPPVTEPAMVRDVIRESLSAAGLSRHLLDEALDDEDTWRRVVDTTLSLRERLGDVGVPTIVLDGGQGPAIFGPVIVDVPSDDDALELWRHTEWLTRYGSFAELKRKRSGPPALPASKYRTQHG